MNENPPRFFRIRNFEKYQHYRDRKPPWIKLYRDILRDPSFFALEDHERYHLFGLFLIASQNDNLIPNNAGWLRHELNSSRPISLKKLIDTGWIEVVEQDASTVLADSEHASTHAIENACLETETDTAKKGMLASCYHPDFEIFWTAYPRKTGKGAAWKAWHKLRPSRQLQDRILAAIGKARASVDWTRQHGQYIPHPTTWLNQARWDDQISDNGDKPISVHDFL